MSAFADASLALLASSTEPVLRARAIMDRACATTRTTPSPTNELCGV
jgi:hypothetical protein